MVRGTRDNVRVLMGDGEDILVFPGGGNEVFKDRGQRYKLLWKERIGFARLAIEHGYPIVPFAAVGAEEMLDIVADGSTPVFGQLSALMKKLAGVSLPPIAFGVGPTLVPEAGAAVLLVRRADRHEVAERWGRGRAARRGPRGGRGRHRVPVRRARGRSRTQPAR